MTEQNSAVACAAGGSGDRGRRTVMVGLTASSSLGLAASTIYVPAIPTIAHALNTSIAAVQLTFVGYLLAFAAGMLAWGPLSDHLGRRPALVCGLIVSAVASLGCTFSPTVELLIAGRALQGFGTCAGFVVGRAIARDLWGTKGAARAIAALGITATLTQASAPVLGGYVTAAVGWRANFAIIALFASLAILLICPRSRRAAPNAPTAILSETLSPATSGCSAPAGFSATRSPPPAPMPGFTSLPPVPRRS